MIVSIFSSMAQWYARKQSLKMSQVYAARKTYYKKLGKKPPATGAAAHKNKRHAIAKRAKTQRRNKREESAKLLPMMKLLKQAGHGDEKIATAINSAAGVVGKKRFTGKKVWLTWKRFRIDMKTLKQ